MVDVDDLRLGSLVRLACGSPKMAVTAVVEDDEHPKCWLVSVVWYSDLRGIETGTFPPNLLVYPRPAISGPGEEPST
jgi:uncharacterized protein YodC (DUF2158 family)